MMKSKYTAPELEEVRLAGGDVVTASGEHVDDITGANTYSAAEGGPFAGLFG